MSRMKSRNIDTEHLCSQAFPIMRKVMSDNYVKHECTSDKGCQLKLVIIDGNEKNRRKLCSAPKLHVTGNLGKANFYKLCTGNPMSGIKSKYCEKHQYFDYKIQSSASASSPTQNDLRPITRAFAKDNFKSISIIIFLKFHIYDSYFNFDL